jgi:hypothetical protein
MKLGTYFIAGIGLILIIITTIVIIYLSKRFTWIKKLADFLSAKLFYNAILRYCIQAYMKYCEASFDSF